MEPIHLFNFLFKRRKLTMQTIFVNIPPIYSFFQLVKINENHRIKICNDRTNYTNFIDFATKFNISVSHEYFNEGDVDIEEMLEMSNIEYKRLDEQMFQMSENINLEKILERWFRERYRISEFPSYSLIRDAKLSRKFKIVDPIIGAYFEGENRKSSNDNNIIIETSVFYFKYIKNVIEYIPVEVLEFLEDGNRFAISFPFRRTTIINFKKEFIDFPPKRFCSKYIFKKLTNDEFIFNLETLNFSMISEKGEHEFIENYEI